MEKETIAILQKKLPDWAVKAHPSKKNMSVIHPMAVIDQLNEAFGEGEWQFMTEYIACNPVVQNTKNGDRFMYMSAVKGILVVPKHGIHIEQYGGSSNDDMGDALKGGATDALTKCASYLGVGASIYKGQGNIEPEVEMELGDVMTQLYKCETIEQLKEVFTSLGNWKTDPEVVAAKEELKKKLTN